MMQAAEERRTPPVYSQARAPCVKREQIEEYLAWLVSRGCTAETVKIYRRGLMQFFQALPLGKSLRRDTLALWRDALEAKGYMPRTVNLRLSAVNNFLEYIGLREYQLPLYFKLEKDEVRLELTRSEYLRLLSAAKTLDRERTYLLIKLFASTGLAVQELPRLTAAAVRAGRFVVEANRTKRIVELPACLREELLDFLGRMGIQSGPVFVTRSGKPIHRGAVTGRIQRLSGPARVAPEKCNPRCLHRLYQATWEGIRANIDLLVEQAHARLLEQEQLTVGWAAGESGAHRAAPFENARLTGEP